MSDTYPLIIIDAVFFQLARVCDPDARQEAPFVLSPVAAAKVVANT